MAIPLRRVLRVLYPSLFSGPRAGTPRARFAKRFIFRLFLVLVFLKAAFLLFYYNTFLSLQYDVEESRAQIDTQLQRRKNIILNLGLMVRDYARHEREIFNHTTDTRKEMLQAGPETSAANPPLSSESSAPPAPQASDGQGTLSHHPAGDLDALLSKARMTDGDLDALLSKVFAIAERYPDLRLSENFQRFMDALVDAENTIAEQRMLYNKRANIMSTEVGKFPGFVFAKLYRFEAPAFFKPEQEARKPPHVEELTP